MGKLVQARTEYISEACNEKEGNTLSIAGIDEAKLQKLCKEAIEAAEADGHDMEVCQVSNIMFKKGFTVGGTKNAIAKCQKLATDAKALQIKIVANQGATNTVLMKLARNKFEKYLFMAADEMQVSKKGHLYMSFDALSYPPGTHPRVLCGNLCSGITSAVKWRDLIEQMIEDGTVKFYECGPMKQLKAMMKRIDNTGAYSKTYNIEV